MSFRSHIPAQTLLAEIYPFTLCCTREAPSDDRCNELETPRCERVPASDGHSVVQLCFRRTDGLKQDVAQHAPDCQRQLVLDKAMRTACLRKAVFTHSNVRVFVLASGKTLGAEGKWEQLPLASPFAT